MLKKDKLRDIYCGIQWMSYGNQVEEVLKILILKCVIKQTKLCGPTSKLEDSKSNFWKGLSLGVSLIAAVMAKHALYWIDSTLSWKALLKI